MPISRAGLVAAGCLLLAACGSAPQSTRNAPSRIELPGGTVVAGAEGWCIDEATSQADGETTVVILGSCAAISGDAFMPQPDVPGVVTVSVETRAGTPPDSEALEKFFISEAGRATLARDGDSASVAILETRREDGLLYLHASDESAAPGASNEIWRALFDISGKFVAVSFYSRLEDAIDPLDGLATLSAQVAELRRANRS
jgi:hypothetical protein